MHLHLFMICVHVFVKVEITRSEVAAQTIQFAESFSWTRTKWKNSSVCGSGVEPEKLWTILQSPGRTSKWWPRRNMFQFRWLPNPSLLEKINTQQKHWYTTGLVLDLFILRSSDDNEWQGGGIWLVQVWHRENSSPRSFQREWSREKIAEPRVTKALTLHQLYVAKVSQTSPPHPQIHLFDSDRSRWTSDCAGADCPHNKLPAISMVVSCCIMLYPVLVVDLHCKKCQLCVMWPWKMVSVTDLFAPTIFGLKPGAEHGEGDGLVGSTWGVLKLGTSLFCCIGRGHLTLPCSLHPKMNSLLVCSFCSVSFCIDFWPFHLGIDSCPFAMVQTHFVPWKLDGWAYYTGWPAIWVAERYLYPIYGLQQLDLYSIPIVICPCHHGFPRVFMDFPWFSHGFPMIFSWISHGFAAWIFLQLPKVGTSFRDDLQARVHRDFAKKEGGVQMVSAIRIIDNHEDFEIL